MKKMILLVISGLFGIAASYLTATFVRAQSECCAPPNRPTSVPRFPPGVTVTAHVNMSTGFTQAEYEAIKTGIEDWTLQQNNSGINFVVTDAPDPPIGTANTIFVKYDNHQSSTDTAHNQMFSSGTSVSSEIVFHQNIRNGNPSFLPGFVRSVARHETGHP